MKEIKKKDIIHFLDFEEKNKLDELLFRKRKIWPFIRYNIFYYLLDEKQYSYDTKSKKKLKLESLKKIFKSIYTLKNIFSRCDVLIYDYGRPEKIGKKIVNPLSFALSKSLPNRLKICYLNKDYNYNSEGIDGNHNKINFYFIYKIIFYVYICYLKIIGINKITSCLDNKIMKAYKNKIRLESIIYNVFCHQIILGLIFEIIFLIKKPKIIFYSDNAEMTDVKYRAGKRDIITVDVQHSIISDLNILYQQPYTMDKKYLSDYILTYSKYWHKFISIKSSKIEVGNYLRDFYLKKFKKKSKSNNNITIISSIVSRAKLIKLAKKISIKFPNNKIIYKLRPEEYNNWKLYYPKSLSSLHNVEFVYDKKKELYEYLYNSQYVIGTNSTVLIQAIPFANVIVIKSGWHNELRPLIKDGLIKFAKNDNEVLEIIFEDHKKKNKKGNILYKKNFESNIKKFTSSLNI